MTILDIQYGKEFELARAKHCVSNLVWYEDNGYKVSLPGEISALSTEQEITAQLEKEYEEEIYKKFTTELEIEWDKFSLEFEKVKSVAGDIFKDRYTVLLTRYGTGGSYDASLNEIIVKIEERTVSSVLGTLVHEMVHIAIQEYIKKYEVSHWKKERLVDLIVEHYFPNLRPMQNINENVEDVDIEMNLKFPNIEEITKALGRKKF